MDIPVNAAKPGRRRYLTLVMIFITVVICYVDRANLAVASAHIQEEFGITKAEMGYVFSAFAWLYRGARRIRKKSYAKVFRASVRAETSRLPVCGSAARRNRRLG